MNSLQDVLKLCHLYRIQNSKEFKKAPSWLVARINDQIEKLHKRLMTAKKLH